MLHVRLPRKEKKFLWTPQNILNISQLGLLPILIPVKQENIVKRVTTQLFPHQWRIILQVFERLVVAAFHHFVLFEILGDMDDLGSRDLLRRGSRKGLDSRQGGGQQQTCMLVSLGWLTSSQGVALNGLTRRGGTSLRTFVRG